MSSPQPVWDVWVRFGHWLIVFGVVFQQFSGEELEPIDTHATVDLLLSTGCFSPRVGIRRTQVCRLLEYSLHRTNGRLTMKRWQVAPFILCSY